MFRFGDQIRHRNCLDIDLILVSIPYRCDRYIEAKALYWNRNYDMVVFPQAETVKIKSEDFHKWSLVDGE